MIRITVEIREGALAHRAGRPGARPGAGEDRTLRSNGRLE